MTVLAAFAGATALAISPLAGAVAASAGPDNYLAIDFADAGYTVGAQSPAGQNGWNNWGQTSYDYALVDNAGTPVLRFSNGTGNFGNINQLSSPALVEAAGEPITGAEHDVFETSFVVASSTGAAQTGLNVQVAIDGDGTTSRGSRAGGIINLRHTADGLLEVWTHYPVPGGEAETLADWKNVSVTVPANAAHTIRYVVTFIEGDGNDTASLWVDGTLVADGIPSWEELHDATDGTKKTVDGLLFRILDRTPTSDGLNGWGADADATNSTTRADLAGNGFLFSDISYATYDSAPPADPTPGTAPSTPTGDANLDSNDATAPGGTLSFSADGFDPYEWVGITVYSTPFFAGWFQANAAGVVSGSIVLPTSLSPGTHTLQAAGATSGRIATTAFIAALPDTGAEPPVVPLAASGLLLLVGLGAVIVGRRAARARRDATHRA